MQGPSADELAAIAAAYLAVMPCAQTPHSQGEVPPRWSMAGRLPSLDDPQRVRFAARSVSRWKAAGRLDG